MTNPFFIISSGRSGSTLLASMLNMHPAFHIPVELIGLYSVMPKRMRFYGDLEDPFNRLLIARDLATLGQLQAFSVAFDPQSFAARLGEGKKDFRAVVQAFYDELLAKSGKKILGDKTPNHIPFIDQIDRTFPSCKVVHLVRDGRDVAISSMRSRKGIYFRNIYELGINWADRNLNIAEFGLRNPERYHRFRYEDLVRDPEKVLGHLCEYLGVSFDNRMLEHQKSDFARENAAQLSHHSNLTRGLMSNNVEKWRNQMGNCHLQVYEKFSSDALRFFKYPTASVRKELFVYYSQPVLAIMTLIRKALRSLRQARIDIMWLVFTLAKRRWRVLRIRKLLKAK